MHAQVEGLGCCEDVLRTLYLAIESLFRIVHILILRFVFKSRIVFIRYMLWNGF